MINLKTRVTFICYNPESVKTLRFPLGYFTKNEIRNLAKFFRLDVADKPDSQDICLYLMGIIETF